MKELETIKLNNIEYVRKDSMPAIPKEEGTPIGQYCIVRCRNAGVWAGIVAAVADRNVTLVNARRLWYWVAVKGHTLSAVANYGIKKESKIPASVNVVYLTESCEILPTSTDAQKTITAMEAHNE